MSGLAKEYGTAMFMLAAEKKVTAEYADELRGVRDIFSENSEYAIMLDSPSIPLGERLEAIEKAFFGRVSEDVLSFVQLLCEKGRMDCFFESVKEYLSLFEAQMNVTSVKVTSAVELTDSEKKKLEEKLEKKYGGRVNMEFFIDGALIGGLVIEADGKIMDGSLRHRLREVKEVINV